MALGIRELHTKVRSFWWGKSASKMSKNLGHFFATKCKPAIECDPEHTFKKDELDRLLEFMRAEGTDSDLKMVKAICTGALHRHPALHGIMSACVEKVHLLDTGKTTFRNPKRYLV